MFMRSFFVGSLLMLSVPLMAQEVDSFISVRKSLLPSNVIQQVEAEKKFETYGKWVGLGKEVGTAINNSLEALTDNTDKFSKTGVGKFTMFIVAFKMLGFPIIQLFLGLLVWIFGTIIATIFFVNNFLPRRVLVSKSKEGKVYENRGPVSENWDDIGTGGGMVLFSLCYVVFLAVCCCVIFIH